MVLALTSPIIPFTATRDLPRPLDGKGLAWSGKGPFLNFGGINSHVVHVIRAGDLISSPDANHRVDCGG